MMSTIPIRSLGPSRVEARLTQKSSRGPVIWTQRLFVPTIIVLSSTYAKRSCLRQ